MALEVLDSVSSTMDIARENVLLERVGFDSSGQAVPFVGVVAREQTAGRGQRGRFWYAVPGESLCATYYFRNSFTAPEHAAQIAMLAGVAMTEGIQSFHRDRQKTLSTAAELQEAGLKWPNDLVLQGKKVGGILVEMLHAPEGGWVALIGIGLNVAVSHFPPEIAKTAASLQTGPLEPGEMELLAERIAIALHLWADRGRREGFPAVLAAWRACDRTPGRRFHTSIEGTDVLGTAEGVDEHGALLLRLPEGALRAVTSASSLLPTVTTRPPQR